jgi:hypothetical protein
MARVDPHLVFGCEAMPDVDDAVKGMEHAQHTFLRRLLGLNPRSVLCVLFTETGIMPLRNRHAELVLRFLASPNPLCQHRAPRFARPVVLQLPIMDH